MWDHLTFKEGTQAHHITKVLDYEEWISMEEILRRVNELFGILYQNERSLYPYLKTLVDAGLLEANMVGGKMKWRKKNLIITVGEEIEEEIVNRPVSQPLN
jgi:DNA-binding PadR family transcriptional regulator